MVQRRGKRLQQRHVECKEHAEARKDFLIIHSIHSISRRLGLDLPLDIGSLGQKSEVDGVQLFLALNKVTAQINIHPLSLHPIISKSCGDRCTTKP